MLDIATLLGIGWDGVKAIFKRHLLGCFGRPSLSWLKYIAIDEISVRKGQKYLKLVWTCTAEPWSLLAMAEALTPCFHSWQG